jgi:hypothetical protein
VPKPVKTHCNKLKNETLVNRSRFVVLVLWYSLNLALQAYVQSWKF